MRKYFLLSAVALMLTTTANATTDYAEVTAKATIEVAGTFSCTPLDFGTIVVKQKNNPADVEMYMVLNGETPEGDIISVTGLSPSTCTNSNDPFNDDNVMNSKLPNSITLTNSNGNTLSVDSLSITGANNIEGTLRIPAEVKAGDYTGSFTLTHTY